MLVLFAALLALASSGTHDEAAIRPCRIAGQGPVLQMTVGAVRIDGRIKMRSAESIAAIALKNPTQVPLLDGTSRTMGRTRGLWERSIPDFERCSGMGFQKRTGISFPIDKRKPFPESMILVACDASSK